MRDKERYEGGMGTTKNSLVIACIQTTSTNDVEKNVTFVHTCIESAAKSGANLVLFPENVFYMKNSNQNVGFEPYLSQHQTIFAQLKQLAIQYKIAIHVGSFPEKISGSDKIYNSSVILHKDGTLGPLYRKIHLFNLVIENGSSYKESDHVCPGGDVVMDVVEGWNIGLSICYDLRFPELYRELSKMNLDVILVPSAFTVTTGPDHWEILLRSRAIENQCYLVASAQCGQHTPQRSTYGHSMVVDPWGRVVDRLENERGMIVHTLRREIITDVRRKLPALRDRVIKSGLSE